MIKYNNGLNNVDVVYYINLDHRKDRYNHINKELAKTNIELSKINRISGIYMKDFGSLGCSKSHCLALEMFINSPETNQTCIILEDDFEFTKEQPEINNLINRVFNELKEFDVLMLSTNIINDINTPYDFISKIIDAQTTSGYIVSRKFAPVLLQNYKQGILNLERLGYRVDDFCIDIYMKKLQPCSNWYCLKPKIGKQMESFSDIEKHSVNYGC